MAPTSKETETKKPRKSKDRATEIANTFEWLITAFILAFVFRAFVMEAFRIPTGSMADTLKGAHWRLRCPQCGYKYDRGFMPGRMNPPLAQDTVPPTEIPVKPSKCPSCAYLLNNGKFNPQAKVNNGDRILVLKCLYQIFDPKRWDVIVFKNPLKPTENYIKRLIALPNEKLEIVDGDVYINGNIARKPPKVQQELWMPIYCNNYQPIHPEVRSFNYNRSQWINPFSTIPSKWTIRPEDPTRLHLDGPANEVLSVHYDPSTGNDFRASYAYNHAILFQHMPECSDLMVEFYATFHTPTGKVGAMLSKYGTEYRGWVDSNGQMVLEKGPSNSPEVLNSVSIPALTVGKPTKLRFENVDRLLTLTYGEEKISYDLNGSINSLKHNPERRAQVELLGTGKLSLAHISIYRDIHYLNGSQRSGRNCRASEGNPFQLNDDEFFVLGDNSPNSEDARWWSAPLEASKGMQPPRAGIVPRDYLVGKALFVYWPGGFRFPWSFPSLSPASQNASLFRRILRLRSIPNIGDMRFIYGGTSENMAQQPSKNSGNNHPSDS